MLIAKNITLPTSDALSRFTNAKPWVIVLLPMVMQCQPAHAHFLVLVRFKINWDQLYNLDGSRIYVAALSETIPLVAILFCPTLPEVEGLIILVTYLNSTGYLFHESGCQRLCELFQVVHERL